MTSETGLRSFSAVAGSLSILPLYLIGRRKSFRNAVIIGTIACFLPVQIYFSQEAKMYSFLVMLSSISFLGMLEYRDPRVLPSKRAGSLLMMVSNMMLVYTHYYSYLFVLAQLGYLVYLDARYGGRLRIGSAAKSSWTAWMPLATGTIWLLFLLSEGLLFEQTTGGGIGLSIWGILSIYPFLAGSYVSPGRPEYAVMVLASLFFLVTVIMGAIFREKARKGFPEGRPIAVTFLLGAPLAALALSLTVMNIYGQRYFLVLSPVLFFLAGVQLASRKLGKWRGILFYCVIVLSIMALPVQYYSTEKDDWRGAVSFIEDNLEEGDVVVPVPHWERRSIEYYGPDLEIEYGSDEAALDERSEGFDRIWLVIKDLKDDAWTYDHLVSSMGSPIIHEEFHGLSLYLFERK